MNTLTILSVAMLIETGDFSMRKISKAVALEMLRNTSGVENFSGHQTTKILGITPSTRRDQCRGYSRAIVIKPRARLDFGKEYSLADIETIGYDILLIEKGGKSEQT